MGPISHFHLLLLNVAPSLWISLLSTHLSSWCSLPHNSEFSVLSALHFPARVGSPSSKCCALWVLSFKFLYVLSSQFLHSLSSQYTCSYSQFRIISDMASSSQQVSPAASVSSCAMVKPLGENIDIVWQWDSLKDPKTGRVSPAIFMEELPASIPDLYTCQTAPLNTNWF